MKRDNLRLIAEVKKRRALWDSTMQMTLRKDIIKIQWQEVADILKQNVQYCKKRFKGFRDSYRSEIRKIQQGRIDNSNWTYFRAMEFMRNIFDPDVLVLFEPQPLDMEFDNGDQAENDLFINDVDDDSFDFEIMGDIFKRAIVEPQGQDSGSDLSVATRQTFDQCGSNISNPIIRIDVESSPEVLSPLLPKPPSAKRARRRNTSSSPDVPQYHNGQVHDCAVEPKTPALPASDCGTDVNVDPDRSFLISLLPHVKMLTPMDNMKFRMQITQLLFNLNQHKSQPISPNFHIPISATNYNGRGYETETTSNGLPSTLNAANAFLAQSSVIECDVKIENEPMF